MIQLGKFIIDNLQRPYLSTRLAAAQFPEKTKSQRGYPRFLGEGGQGRGDEGQDQGERRPGALAVGAVREERQQGEEAGEEVGAADHTGHRLAVDRMRREQEAGDRVAQAVPSRQHLENATNSRSIDQRFETEEKEREREREREKHRSIENNEFLNFASSTREREKLIRRFPLIR